MMNTHTPQPRSGLITGSRWLLTILAVIFTLGAFAQFFLVGVSFFDDAARWKVHANLGHILGLLPYVMWIPAVLGKTRAGVILATVMLFFLYMAQYAFINVDNTMAQALHPLNGSLLLVLSFWITSQSIGSLRHRSEPPTAHPEADREPVLLDKLERTTS